ncbi:MAG: PD-(D/E)XK nuclease family protein [Usitatibacter sp.]
MQKTLRDDRQGDLFGTPAEAGPAPRVPGRGPIGHEALLARLAHGHGEGLTVLTPSLRLAQSLESDVDALHVAAGRAHWEAPDIIAFAPFVRRCYDEALYGPAGAHLPSLLSDPACLLLWEEAIRASRWREALLSIPATAALAAEAWTLAHAWRIEGALRAEPCSEDAEAFALWAEHYARRIERQAMTDSARLPGIVAARVAQGSIARPAILVTYAFDRITPQQSDFLDAWERAGVEVLRCDPPCFAGGVSRIELEAPRAELEHAARWARSRLEAAGNARAPRIAVVVPDLAKRRREVARVFGRVLGPVDPHLGQAGAALFNISLGEPLSSYPLVDAALALIEVASGQVDYERASRFIRSPFIEAAETEQAERARLDAALRRIAPAALTLMRLRQLVSHAGRRLAAPDCARLASVLDRLIEAQREGGRAGASDWARRFTAILDAAGFPGERTLDSTEYQALGKWREVVGNLAALNPVAGEWTASEARSRLQRLCADTVFQPRSGNAPVQVLGLLESVGLAFDHLWVSGLTEASWPIAARPHPLIAPALQRRAGIPQASPEEAFKVDQAITRAWREAAPEVVFSSPRADGDRELLASPLVADIAPVSAEEIGIGEYALLRDLLFRAGRGAITTQHDYIGPAVGDVAAKGGTRILVDQAACPFRAFAHFRLDARSLDHPEPGLDAMDRGTLLHAMMAQLWETLKDSATLRATDAETLARMIDEAAAHAIERVRDDRPGRLEGRFAELERERLAGIAREWLAIEAGRPAFRVTMREESMRLTAGNLMIEGRIDRVDHLDSGGLAVIDYKTGRVNVADWMGERPDDAQLPLYALAAGGGAQEVRAVAFARLKTGDRGFVGVARDAAAIPGVQSVDRLRGAVKHSWDELIAQWRREVDLLGDNFAAGDARVDPKALLSTCRWCDLKPLCRVHERLTPLDEGDEDENPEDES